MKYNEYFAKRFTSDYKLPIGVFEEEYFIYFLNLYEPTYNSKSKYDRVCKFVDEFYDGDSESFLKEYYDIRDIIITSTINSEAYKNFNSMPMDIFSIPAEKRILGISKSVYNEGNNHGTFISFDLKSANFQALKYVNPSIVNNCETYDDFIKGFTQGTKFEKFPYIEESKYTRQVIFGKMNASRQQTIENYLIHKVWWKLKDIMGDTLVAHTADELIFRINDIMVNEAFAENFIKEMADDGILLHYEIFSLSCFNLSNGRNNILDFYVKESYPDEKKRFVKVPLSLRAIVEKLYNDEDVNDYDKTFVNDNGTKAVFIENFLIKK